MEQEDVKQSPPLAQPLSPPSEAGRTIDLISKSVAFVVVILYACGFLITSIQHFSYGFVETNPFRPRIAAAGFWFLLFAAIPFALVKQLQAHRQYWEGHERSWADRCILLWIHLTACQLEAITFAWIFDFNFLTATKAEPIKPWLVAIVVTGALLALILLLIIVSAWQKVPKPVKGVAALAICGFLAQSAYRGLFDGGSFRFDAIWLWFFVAGILAYLEMRDRSWMLVIGNWERSTLLTLAGALAFASFYYPHIKSSFGGGSPIPVTIYFTKDSTIMPNQSIGALLVDESDAGVFVVGKGDKKATFIPRSSVGLVYYSDDVSGFSLAKPK
jgi:hypothetical protein